MNQSSKAKPKSSESAGGGDSYMMRAERLNKSRKSLLKVRNKKGEKVEKENS